MPGPASKLVGLRLDGDWTVEAPFNHASSTGGNFSHGYIVRHDDGRTAFLKALDYSRALRAPDRPAALAALTSAYVFERNVLQTCKNEKMHKVVQPLAFGNVLVDHSDIGTVDYLILEKAESDIRSHLDAGAKFDLAWKLRSLHHIAVGIEQLHFAKIAHQDLKPSNALVFSDSGTKIGDLGSASVRGTASPRDNMNFAGDPQYAPPELLYGFAHPDWMNRRFGCDAYLLGSMIVFMFTGLSATGLLLSKLPPQHHHRMWQGTYQEVLPYLQNGFVLALDEMENALSTVPIRGEIKTIVNYLCHPDIALRGHPKNRSGLTSQYSVLRFVTELNVLAKSAELAFSNKRP